VVTSYLYICHILIVHEQETTCSNVPASKLTNRVENFQRWWCLERGHSTGLGSLCARTQTEGKGVSPSWRTSQKPLVRGL